MRRKQALAQLDRDIRDHIEADVADRVARGVAPDEARRQALVAFGNVTLTKEDTRAVWTVRWIEQTLQDLRYAVRMLRRTPAFTTAVVLTLALGIGANTTIFTLFEAVVLRTLPLESPDTLYFVAHGAERAAPGGNYPYFERIAGRSDVFAGVTAYFRGGSVKVSTAEGIGTARSLTVSGNYYDVLKVPLAIGRGFSADDDRPGAGLVAVISDGYWSRRFGRDPQLPGRTLTIDGRPAVVVGVTAAGFSGLDPGAAPEITLPMAVRTLDAPTSAPVTRPGMATCRSSRGSHRVWRPRRRVRSWMACCNSTDPSPRTPGCLRTGVAAPYAACCCPPAGAPTGCAISTRSRCRP